MGGNSRGLGALKAQKNQMLELSHIQQATRMAADGTIPGPSYVLFVMGVKNAMPAEKIIFDFYIETHKRLSSDAV